MNFDHALIATTTGNISSSYIGCLDSARNRSARIQKCKLRNMKPLCQMGIPKCHRCLQVVRSFKSSVSKNYLSFVQVSIDGHRGTFHQVVLQVHQRLLSLFSKAILGKAFSKSKTMSWCCIQLSSKNERAKPNNPAM